MVIMSIYYILQKFLLTFQKVKFKTHPSTFVCLECIMQCNKVVHCATKYTNHDISHVKIPLTLVACALLTCEGALALVHKPTTT